ncbi:hypothetical protein P43SY_002049 [Pythium insidiosum]|uniref:2Fe-2S ferredoxin-type domain-containing protein n=1 Tax=Pythium insidiosum TaxID=114742 RepID=A0AAD5M4N7_PYTIN|nr:hypothetical protein P43SY_002049 [Pythium insidiosum]
MAPSSRVAVCDAPWDTVLEFALNGRPVSIAKPSPRMKLIEYLRDVAELPGTKLSCGEGGCGSCTVVLCHRPLDRILSREAHGDGSVVFRAVNACLFPVCALDGIEVFTIERVGSTITGLHALQQRLVDANGTQCGYCTPGWIMNMYELLREKEPRSKAQIESHFDGNLCRCTGYRPILAAFHSFANDPNEATREANTLAPISIAYDTPEMVSSDYCGREPMQEDEDWLVVPSTYLVPAQDLATTAPYDGKHEIPPSDFVLKFKPRPLRFVNDSGTLKWYRPLTWDQLKFVFEENCLSEIMFVGGRTSYGVSKYYNGTAPYNRPTERAVQVELNYIPELKEITVNPNQAQAVVGASVTITTLLQFLQTYESDHNVGI